MSEFVFVVIHLNYDDSFEDVLIKLLIIKYSNGTLLLLMISTYYSVI